MIAVPRSEAPRVSVIIPASSRLDLVHRCLASLARFGPSGLPFETIVVLNESSETIAAELQQMVAGVQVVASPVNLGLAGAGNYGRHLARGEFLLLLHDDSEVEAGWMEALVSTADAHPEAGAVGGQVLDPDGRLQSAGMILWSDATTSRPWVGEAAAAAPALDRLRAVDYCGTSSLLVPAAVWDAAGGLDEQFYPVYYVDVDFGMALRRLGLVVLFQPCSRTRHHQGASTSSRFRRFVTERNRLLFMGKWGTALEEHGAPQPASPEAINRALARAEKFAEICRQHGPRPGLPVERPAYDPSGSERRCREKSHALQTAYIAALGRAIDETEQDCARWRSAAEASAQELSDFRARFTYLLGTTLRFCHGGEAFRHPVIGHYPPEPWGAWLGHDPLRIVLPVETGHRLTLVLELVHFLDGRDVSPLQVVVNGVRLLHTDERRTGLQAYRLALPAEVSASDRLVIEVEPAKAMSPAEVGLNQDERPLSIGMVSLTVRGGPGPA